MFNNTMWRYKIVDMMHRWHGGRILGSKCVHTKCQQVDCDPYLLSQIAQQTVVVAVHYIHAVYDQCIQSSIQVTAFSHGQKTLIILKLLHIAQQTGSLVAAIAAVVVAVSRLMHSITARDANDVKHSLFLILSEPRPALTPHLSPPNQSQQVLSRLVSRIWRCPE